MGPDTTPHHVGFTLNGFIAILKGCPAIRSPGHFKDALGALDTLDPQPLSERPIFSKIRNELADSQQERCLLRRREVVEVGAEPAKPFEGRHRRLARRRSARRLGSRRKRIEELLSRLKALAPTSGTIKVGLALASLPFRRPEPRLRGIDDLLRPQQNAIFGQLSIKEVAFLKTCRTPDLLRQSDLTLCPQRGPRHGTSRHSESKKVRPSRR